jgi:hypothetical protein
MNREELRELVLRSLRKQGFRMRAGRLVGPNTADKAAVRHLHETAVAHKIERSAPGLRSRENQLLRYIAAGTEVRPDAISPRLVEVKPDSEEELLFRYVALHWTIPTSSGYGRRLRFIVLDDNNGKLIGLIGLCDPVFSLRVRDDWVGWDHITRRARLRNVMDAFVLGAVPPYSSLLCGKLVAMLACSNQVRDRFRRKYSRTKSIIRRAEPDARIAMLTTMSALGRSSIYNRLTFDNRHLLHSVGFSQGSGEFHFSNGLYGSLFEYVTRYSEPTAKQETWGEGFRNRREVIRKALGKLKLSPELIYHGIQREVFVAPLASNTREFLRGEHHKLLWHDHNCEELSKYFHTRWLAKRIAWDHTYQDFDPESFRLWPARGAQ